MACILDYNWPGNVRELRGAVEHAVVMCNSARIEVRDLPASVRQQTPLLRKTTDLPQPTD